MAAVSVRPLWKSGAGRGRYMGASGWDYSVPYQEDLVGAFDALRRKVFEERVSHPTHRM
ncbi:hypothetical protein [Streptomyces sp. NPDC090026]|uniref:hypothetical protein n=1 Tax=Streptomyces sp. NPDC090026 TaxID=3365923 RepID=UPI00381CD383